MLIMKGLQKASGANGNMSGNKSEEIRQLRRRPLRRN